MPLKRDPIGISVDTEERDGQKIVSIQFNRKIFLEKVREIRGETP